jgi:hypothetical protein
MTVVQNRAREDGPNIYGWTIGLMVTSANITHREKIQKYMNDKNMFQKYTMFKKYKNILLLSLPMTMRGLKKLDTCHLGHCNGDQSIFL